MEVFCKTHRKASIIVGGFDGFSPKVVFLKVKESTKARNMFDGEDLHFHSTIAQKCDEKFNEVIEYLKAKECFLIAGLIILQ